MIFFKEIKETQTTWCSRIIAKISGVFFSAKMQNCHFHISHRKMATKGPNVKTFICSDSWKHTEDAEVLHFILYNSGFELLTFKLHYLPENVIKMSIFGQSNQLCEVSINVTEMKLTYPYSTNQYRSFKPIMVALRFF